MATLLNCINDVNIIELFPISSIKSHVTKGTIKDGNENPLERDVSAYKEITEDGKKELQFQKSTTSDSNGDFELNINDNGKISFTIIVHGSSGENNVVFKDVMVP